MISPPPPAINWPLLALCFFLGWFLGRLTYPLLKLIVGITMTALLHIRAYYKALMLAIRFVGWRKGIWFLSILLAAKVWARSRRALIVVLIPLLRPIYRTIYRTLLRLTGAWRRP